MAKSVGKQFEDDWEKSVDEDTCYIYRFKDSPTSFIKVDNVKFTPSNISDYLMFDDITRTLYFVELKTTKGTAFPLSNVREEQIKQLTKASKHNLIAGLVINFRERQNYTIFVDIQTFNKMCKEINKKSFNIIDFTKYGCTPINSELKRVHYRYDIKGFMKKIHK